MPLQSDNLLSAFDYQPRTRVLFGPGMVERVGQLVKELGGRKVLLVTDKGIVAAGHAGRVRSLLESEGLKSEFFEQVEENPSTRCVAKCVQVAYAAGSDLIAGLGVGAASASC